MSFRLKSGKRLTWQCSKMSKTLFLYRREVRRFMKYDLRPGSKLPCYAGALGKALLAGLSHEEFNQRVDRIDLTPITPKTISSKKKLREEIMETRKRGYSISDQELSLDMYSIGVPLLDKQGKVVAAINVSMEIYSRAVRNWKVLLRSWSRREE